MLGMDCTEQDPVTNFRITNDVIFVLRLRAYVRGNVTSVAAAQHNTYIHTYHSRFIPVGLAGHL
jgi:hypothetical protein